MSEQHPNKNTKNESANNCKTIYIPYQSFFLHRSFPWPVKNGKYYICYNIPEIAKTTAAIVQFL